MVNETTKGTLARIFQKIIPREDYFDPIFDEDEQASEELTTARAWVFAKIHVIASFIKRTVIVKPTQDFSKLTTQD